LSEFPTSDYANELIAVINNNPLNKVKFWKEKFNDYSGKELTTWFEYAYKLRIIHLLDNEVIQKILLESSFEKNKRYAFVIHSNKQEVILNDINLKEECLHAILNQQLHYNFNNYNAGSLGVMTIIMHPHLLSWAFERDLNDNNFSELYQDLVRYRNNGENNNSFYYFENKDIIDEKISRFVKEIQPFFEEPISDWRNSIKNWDLYIEAARNHFGDCKSINIIATLSANIKTKNKRFEEYESLDDVSLSLCKRVCCARMKSGNLNYWTKQLKKTNDIELTLLVFLTWATPRTIVYFDKTLKRILNSLDYTIFSNIDLCCSHLNTLSKLTTTQIKYLENNFTSNTSEDLKFLLRHRIPVELKNKYVYDNIKSINGNISTIQELKLRFLINSFLKKPNETKILKLIRDLYSDSKSFDYSQYIYVGNEKKSIPIDIAKLIMEAPNSYPKYLTSIAENSCWIYALNNKNKVGLISEKEGWFSY